MLGFTPYLSSYASFMGEALRLDNPLGLRIAALQAMLESEPMGIGVVYLRLIPSRMDDGHLLSRGVTNKWYLIAGYPVEMVEPWSAKRRLDWWTHILGLR
jgi:hypothetical protein